MIKTHEQTHTDTHTHTHTHTHTESDKHTPPTYMGGNNYFIPRKKNNRTLALCANVSDRKRWIV